jgi:hypothetical protein
MPLCHSCSAKCQQHAVTRPAGAIAPEEPHLGDRLGPRGDETGTGVRRARNRSRRSHNSFFAKTECDLADKRTHAVLQLGSATASRGQTR